MSNAGNFVARLRPLRLPRVCVAVIAKEPSELLDKAEALVRDNHFLELRLDYLPRPGFALPKIKQFTESHPHVAVVATCRRAGSGGKFKGTIASQLDILGKAAAAGCQLVDVELQTVVRLKPLQVQRLRDAAALILSYHDFHATKNLERTLQKMTSVSADFYKLVTTATNLYDNVQMMKFIEQNSDKYSLIGLCMGEQGIISRVLGLRAGSIFTFAAVSQD